MGLREYELMYIVRPNMADEDVPNVTNRVDGMIGNLGGEVAENNPWGKRRLAYPIQDHEDGFYVVTRLRMDPNRIGELEELLRISDDVIRHILVNPQPPLKVEQPQEAQTQA